MAQRIVFIHGNGTSHWSFGFSSWLKKELDSAGYVTFFETFPDSVLARSEYWLPFLKKFVKVGPDDVLVGWSSGAVAAMRYGEENEIKGSVLISPSYTDLNDESEKVSGYFDKPWQWEKIKNNQEKIVLFYGDDDPFIPQSEFEHIATRLTPVVFKINKGGHFMDQETFPELLEYIKKNY